MGALKATLCAGTALLAALAPATAYAADAGNAGDTGRVAVVPARPAPGTEVTLRVHGCAGKSAVAVSAAFESAARLSLTSSDGALVGAGRIRATARAGAYPVEVRCGADRHEGRLTVAAGPRPTPRDARDERPEDRPPAPTAATKPPAHTSPTTPTSPTTDAPPVTHASPVAPVHAGGGGVARLAASGAGNDRTPKDESGSAGPGTAHAVTGLLLAGVAVVAVALRSARRSRGTD